ncbi:MAG: hypothetical protein HZA01_17190 [Nitrospinae bacterium]|nr:hypothetical protein [Nitrospinota bacterium]
MTAKKTIKTINGVFLSLLSSLLMLLCIIQFCSGTAVAGEKDKIAIFDCENAVEGASEYAKGVVDTFTDIFSRSTKLVIFERSQLQLAMKERDSSLEGGKFKMSEEDQAKMVESLGATKIVVSKLTKSKTNLILTARFIDVGSKQVVTSVKAQANENDYDFLADKVADELLKNFTKESVLTDKEQQEIAKMDIPQDEKEKMRKAQKREEGKQEAQEALGTIGGVFGGMFNAVGGGNAGNKPNTGRQAK